MKNFHCCVDWKVICVYNIPSQIPIICRPRKGKKYALLRDGGLVKGYLWRIWVIRRHSGGGGGWGGSQCNQQSCGRWCAWVWISPIPESAVPDNGKVGNQVLCPHYPVLFRCYLVDVSSVFWLFFQANLILINHPRQTSLAKNEWQVCRKVVIKHSINQIKTIQHTP